MPRELTQAERTEVTQYVHRTVKTVACSWCGQNKWGVEPTLVELRTFDPAAFVVGGPVYPLVTIICGNCGHTMLFNALKMGLTIEKKEEESDAKQSS